jgi:hydroxymethylbilane synthase
MIVRIGSRGSKLALWQANYVAEQLALNGVESKIEIIRTSGDKNQTASINQIGVKGVFIKEIEDALLNKGVEIAVHSLKDLPTETPEGLIFPAICERADPRDCLISRDARSFGSLTAGARVGTVSLRRIAQLCHIRPDLTFTPLRGNVDSRLQKLDAGEYDAVVLAKAGIDRLGLSARITEVFSADICVPAVGQGALGVETRADMDPALLSIVAQLDHPSTRVAVTAERAVLHELQGGCQVPLGAWARFENGTLVIDACVASADGKEYVRKRGVSGDKGAAESAETFGRRVAQELISAGAGRILQMARRNIAG